MVVCVFVCVVYVMAEVLLRPHKHGSTYLHHISHVLCHYMILFCMFWNMVQNHRDVRGEMTDTIELLDEVRECEVTWEGTPGLVWAAVHLSLRDETHFEEEGNGRAREVDIIWERSALRCHLSEV